MNNNGTIRHSGIVDSIEGCCVRVRIQQHAACGSCKLSSHCNSAECKERVIEVWSSEGAYSPGDSVFVTITTSMAAEALLYGFGLPLILLIAVVVVILALTGSEGQAGIGAIIALVPYYAILWLQRKRLRRRMAFGLERNNN